jgi:hypothetical protein
MMRGYSFYEGLMALRLFKDAFARRVFGLDKEV